MKRRSFISLLTAVLSRAQDLSQPAAPVSPAVVQSGFTIAGVIVNAGTSAPISKAVVQIASTTNRSENREVVTGLDGRFSFSNLPAHKFSLTVTRQSGSPQAYLSHGSFSSAILTGPDQDTSNIVFRFQMPGTLAGTVLDESNEPVRNATVHLFSHQVDAEGIKRLVSAGSSTTRSSGQFRSSHLMPGEYIVGVSAQPWFAESQRGLGRRMQRGSSFDTSSAPVGSPEAKADSQFDVAYSFTYYPGVSDYASASPVVIKEGGESAISLTLRTVPSITVRLVGGDTRPGVGTVVMVSSVGPDGNGMAPFVNGFAQNGQGEIAGIAPGRYLLNTNRFNSGNIGPHGDSEAVISHSQPSRRIVDLANGSIVDLNAGSHIAIEASIKMAAADDRPSNRIGFQLRDPTTGVGLFAMADKDDTVHFPADNAKPGRYKVVLSNAPLFRLMALEAKGAKVSAGGELTVEGNSDVQLSVLIGRRSSVNVEGFAMAEKSPAVGVLVLLLPKTTSMGSAAYRDQSDSNGSFILRNVSAGTYLALAIENGHDLAFGEAAAIKPYLAGGVTVTVSESAAPPSLKLPVQQRLA